MNDFIKEACVENLQQALAAENKGADRIELCANIHLGGTTPSEKLITQVSQKLKIPICVMIRPRAGDFVYTPTELNKMTSEIEFCKKVGVEGVVFGVLNTDNTLNIKEIARLTNFSRPLKVVIHKAIDETPAPLKAVKKLMEIEGIDTLLTSGGAETAFQGKEMLKKMLHLAKNRLEIMPAGKITSGNIQELHELLNATSYHGKQIVGKL